MSFVGEELSEDAREVVRAGMPLDMYEPDAGESLVTHADVMGTGILKPTMLVKRGRGRPRTVAVNYLFFAAIYIN